MNLYTESPSGWAETRVYPIYIVLDASASMRIPGPSGHRPMDDLAHLTAGMLIELSDSPVAAHTAVVAILSFSDSVEVLRPLSPLSRRLTVPAPRSGTETNYGAVLQFILDNMPRDQYRITREQQERVPVFAPPLIFFITDGAPFSNGRLQPPEEWRPYRDALVGPPVHARIIALGLVGADARILRMLATGRGPDINAFIATDGADMTLLPASVTSAVKHGIWSSIRDGSDIVIPAPYGMRRVTD